MRVNEQTANIQREVEKVAGEPGKYVESAVVVEGLSGKQKWQGIVEVFRLEKHRQARHAYAWTVENDGQIEYVVVLETPPVYSPNAAVRHWLKAQIKP